MAKAMVLNLARLIPMASEATSLSRMAIMALPRGARRIFLAARRVRIKTTKAK